ncbi:MAG: ABC transporter ATP-binding protein [Anaerolineae bacterium]|nr:ABC transporter ATP-binding protein [Anaerolineae bacterium]MCO5190769.1 ABC transporter ATP-binding protein [Anaerolineae bacterium]MCO5192493.1 ABC transporter ATP-binding protein [Anaerolineae bacterium]MCO5199898.1 ABC transporter ATP-binding protein [Anaerolineae bacterium]MCO5207336.1 ABC transporter ATP-binding protein [Anaerolineae bacterium]
MTVALHSAESPSPARTDQPLLEGRGVSKFFGGLAALTDVDFQVYRGEVMGLIGPNGSGKTTLFDCLSCVQRVSQGEIHFKGTDITKFKPYQVAHLGLARTFQVIRVYRKLTVLENMLLSLQWGNLTMRNKFRPNSAETEARARQLIDFLLLKRVTDEKAGNLSGGQQRLLEIGMALMPDPDLLLLDEATSGVNPTLIEEIKSRIRILNEEQGKTFLLIEHNVQFISDLCSRVFVLNYGEKLAEGTPDEIMNNQEVIEAYFGAEAGDDDGF